MENVLVIHLYRDVTLGYTLTILHGAKALYINQKIGLLSE